MPNPGAVTFSSNLDNNDLFAFNLFYNNEYTIKDHLGNTRICFTDKDGNGVIDITGNAETNEILEESQYYAFGMSMEGAWMKNLGRENAYLYNGKEFNDDFGLDWYHYGARFYDPAIARWNAVDPLGELTPNWTPFRYGFNNPISMIDPNGMSEEYYSDGYGTWNSGAASVDGGFTVSIEMDGEYEKNENGEWVKVSEKGDNINVDFYHGDAISYVTDKNGNWNSIRNGRYILLGEERGGDITWQNLFGEFNEGTGPERSLFIGNENMNSLFREINTFSKKLAEFGKSGKLKQPNKIEFGLGVLGALKGDLPNGQAFFMGSFNFSFYRLGDKILTIAQDSKTRGSNGVFATRPNYSRSEGAPSYKSLQPYPITPSSTSGRILNETTTYQTYIFLTNN